MEPREHLIVDGACQHCGRTHGEIVTDNPPCEPHLPVDDRPHNAIYYLAKAINDHIIAPLVREKCGPDAPVPKLSFPAVSGMSADPATGDLVISSYPVVRSFDLNPPPIDKAPPEVQSSPHIAALADGGSASREAAEKVKQRTYDEMVYRTNANFEKTFGKSALYEAMGRYSLGPRFSETRLIPILKDGKKIGSALLGLDGKVSLYLSEQVATEIAKLAGFTFGCDLSDADLENVTGGKSGTAFGLVQFNKFIVSK